MNGALRYSLKVLRKRYRKAFEPPDRFGIISLSSGHFDLCGQQASDWIKNKLLTRDPMMAARLGYVELDCLLSYHFINQEGSFLEKSARFIRGEIAPFWWDRRLRRAMSNNAGFFPATDSMLSRFSALMLENFQHVDILGSWLAGEGVFRQHFRNATRIPLHDLEPFRNENPWSQALENKTVLVIHPFEATIRKQYAKRDLLFRDKRVLPSFHLKTLRAVQSIANTKVDFDSWFEALDFMLKAVENIRFDIAIVGCGAYGFPLAAFIKEKLERQAIHLGGATQMLFGIKGRRWDEQNLYNEHWTNAAPEETPANFSKVEGGCYW